MQETRRADTYHWVTLTYDQTPFDDNNMMTLDKTDFQKFIKRLRKKKRDFSKQSIKYYACGEYGSKNKRPHYHAIIFNSCPQHIQSVWDGFYSPVSELPAICGNSYFDQVNENTIAYTAKYMQKGRIIPSFKGDLRAPEFQLFSQGIGSNFITDATRTFYNADPSRSGVHVNGFRKALPEYFYNKLVICPVFRLAKAMLAQHMAAEKLSEQLQRWERDKTFHQTFEAYRYTQKVNALQHFRDKASKRQKL